METDKLSIIKKDLIKFANDVYYALGPGHNEVIYHKALLVELRNANYKYDSEVVTPIYYKGHFVGNGRADIIIYLESEKVFILELKALYDLKDKDCRKIQSYMDSLKSKHGMMINFPQNSSSFECDTCDIVKTIRIDLDTKKVY